MILTISTTYTPATDLGYLLHKNPARIHAAELGFGHASVLFPEATEDRCTAALILEVDPIALVRGRRGPMGEGGLLGEYVNDRPYSANSFMVTAIREFFGTALNGRCKERPELAETPIPLEIRIPALRALGGASFVTEAFAPLGYELEVKSLPLDSEFTEWGQSAYVDLTLRATKRVSEVLSHLYVLIPVLDNSKHYWIDEDEVKKLLKRGSGWLSAHPMKEVIAGRYLRHRRLTRLALEQLIEQEGEAAPEEGEDEESQKAPGAERKATLHEQRLMAARDVLLACGAKRVLDLGCGEGKLLRMLLKEKQFESIVGVDVAYRQLERAKERLKLEDAPKRVTDRLKLLHGSLVYRDKRLCGFDAAAVVEVIEHLDPPRLQAFERALFEFARPQTVVVTTPNKEYNAVYELSEGTLRHGDHRFEWSRAEFKDWSLRVGVAHGYSAEFSGVGPVHELYGSPSQMAVFGKNH